MRPTARPEASSARVQLVLPLRDDLEEGNSLNILILLVIGIAFTAFTALVFAVLTLILGKMFESFEVSGPEGWGFFEFYKRYLIVAAVYTFVSLPLGNGLLGIAALAVAYEYVFDAGWVQALVIGIFGGTIALILFALLLAVVLAPLGL